ncbi:MAG: sigma-54 dependent transcriptional regulator [Thermoanaerobaculia bacterium]
MVERRPRILTADDQADVLEALRLLLKREGYDIVAATSPREVLEAVEQGDFDVVLMDLNYATDTTSGAEGLDLLADLKRLDAALPVVVMTAWASIELAVEAVRRGARDFVEKPWENARLLSVLRTQVELGRAVRKGERLEAALSGGAVPEIVAESKAMHTVLEMIERVGPSEAGVLITGENGTGKTLVALALHAVSDRAERPLVTVDVGGLAASVFESELFGHVRGAFTDAKEDRAGRFELADGGTLFLDEIGNVPPSQQQKLLRVVETGRFERLGSSKTRHTDVRVLSATNTDLETAVSEGRFRQDLLYRLKTVEIRLPPLRERLDDIEPLASRFLERHARRYGRHVSGFEAAALDALRRHRWPGNVRELEHAVERAVLLARGERVNTADLGLEGERRPTDPAGLIGLTLEEAERLLVRAALERHGGNVSQAAEELGLSRSALYRRLDKHELD